MGWFCAGNLLLAGTLLLPGAQTNNGCIYLPLSPGALLAGAGGVVLAVQGVLRFLGWGGGQVFPARLSVADTALDVRAFCDTGFSVQEPLSGRTVVLVRFGAVPAVQGRAEHLYAAFADLPPPPDGWEVLVGSETVSSLAHG